LQKVRVTTALAQSHPLERVTQSFANKGDPVMRPTFRRAATAALVVASLAPGLIQGRTFSVSSRNVSAEVGRSGGFFSMVWSLLADVLTGQVPGTGLTGLLMKTDNGGQLEPNGTSSTTTPPPADNGPQLEPNG
jgi:hypothetical protein